MGREGDNKTLVTNRKARHDYHVMDRVETGVALSGTEAKSLRSGRGSLSGCFARVQGEEVFLHNLTIEPYEFGNRFNHEATRPRKLLLHKREIAHLKQETEEKGHTLVPLRLYIRRGWVKLEIGICRGKTHADKRATLRRKTADLEANRAIAAHSRR